MKFSLKTSFLWLSFAIATVLLSACGWTDQKSSSVDVVNYSSEEASSSSGFESRADIIYADSAVADSMIIVPMVGDSLPLNVFLAELPAGTRFNLGLKSQGTEGLKARVYSEEGEIILPRNPQANGSYDEFLNVDQDSNISANSYLTPDSGWFFVEVQGDLSDSFDLEVHFNYDTIPWIFFEDTLMLNEGAGPETSFVYLENGNKDYYLCFPVSGGSQVNLEVDAHPIQYTTVVNSSGDAIDSSTSVINSKYLPSEDDTLCAVTRTKVASYTDGYYAYIATRLFAVDLPQGEYFNTADTFAVADSVQQWGRERNELAEYLVGYEHYVKAFTLTDSASVDIWYGSWGVQGNTKQLFLLDSEQDQIDTLLSADSVFAGRASNLVTVGAGTYYLHFISSQGSFADTTESVHMKSLVIVRDPLNSITADRDTLVLTNGSNVSLDSLTLTEPTDTMLHRVRWEVPQSERSVLDDQSTNTSTDDIIGQSLTAKSVGEAHLIAVSMYYPFPRDTILVQVQ